MVLKGIFKNRINCHVLQPLKPIKLSLNKLIIFVKQKIFVNADNDYYFANEELLQSSLYWMKQYIINSCQCQRLAGDTFRDDGPFHWLKSTATFPHFLLYGVICYSIKEAACCLHFWLHCCWISSEQACKLIQTSACHHVI